MANPLPSKKQHALLQFIDAFIAEHNYAPSYREVMRALDYKSVSTVANHIDGLIERGWLVKRDNSARSVEVVYKEGKGTALPSPASLPDAHELWLLERIATKLSVAERREDATAIIVAALQILELADLQAKLNERLSEQATPPEASSDQQ